MCGIIGVASSEGMKSRLSRLQFLKMGLDIDSWRGWESTGLALVPEGLKDAPIVYKRALNGRDFIQLKTVDKLLNDIEKYPIAIGHNRAATTGRGNITDHNAHPFQYGNITLVHNGHIRNTDDLKGAHQGAECLVDSAHVAFSMNANGEKETLESVDGGFVFVWWNSEKGLLNIARNTERPLHMAFAAKENTFYWASELTELLHLLKDVTIDEEIGILYPKAWNWYQFKLENLREWTRVPFVKSQGRLSPTTQTGQTTGGRTSSHTAGTPWTDEELMEWEWEQQGLMTTERATVSTGRMSKKETDEIEEIRQRAANQRLKDIKQSGIPTSKKRVLRATAELAKLGIQYQGLRNCIAMTWCKYKNQGNLGSVVARTKKEGYTVEVLQVRYEQYLDYKRAGNLLVDCVNVRTSDKNEPKIIGVVNGRMKPYLAKKKEEEEAEKKNGGSTSRDYCGPHGQKVTLARFLEITDTGCANCLRDLDAKQHEEIVWVGHPASPLCKDCAEDPKVMELCGMPQRIELGIH